MFGFPTVLLPFQGVASKVPKTLPLEEPGILGELPFIYEGIRLDKLSNDMTTTTYTWCEKRYNEIALHWLAGTEPDSAATADLRQMAQTCLRYGGRAVLGARGLCEVLLKEYYDEDNCDGDIQTRNAEGTAPAELKTNSALYIVPNPADDMVRIFLPDNLAEWQQVQVFNLSGQQVHAANVPSGTGELSVPVGNWPEGLYIVRVVDGGETSSRSFVVQHRR
jgi:hypothetical protein